MIVNCLGATAVYQSQQNYLNTLTTNPAIPLQTSQINSLGFKVRYTCLCEMFSILDPLASSFSLALCYAAHQVPPSVLYKSLLRSCST